MDFGGRSCWLSTDWLRAWRGAWTALLAHAGVVAQSSVRNFELEYVASHTDLPMALLYTVSAFWAGQQGSLLFWSLALAACISIVVVQNRGANRAVMPHVGATLAGVSLFFLSLLVFAANPFARLPVSAGDGQSSCVVDTPASMLEGNAMLTAGQTETVFQALETLQIELPSWGFANTGTRFGKFLQPAAATTIEEKFSDAGEVHALTGICPTMALHVLWDLPQGLRSVSEVNALAAKYGVRPGSINPTLFQDQIYKYGSLGNPDPTVRKAALGHILDSIGIAKELGSRDVSLWFADGSNYPGTQNMRRRRQWFEEGLTEAHAMLCEDQRMFVEYKPFEPAFYHTDIADWAMALLLSKAAGPKAKVLVDTGHHYQAQNIEQIVAWLLQDGMLGGFHFNDRRYADDDLTLGSIDPYQVFRVFHEIRYFEWETGRRADVAYMIDQSHNLKGKIEAMIQTVMAAQELYAKAALVDHRKLSAAQAACELIDAENCLKDAFTTDVRPAIRACAQSKGLPEDPLKAFRESGYLERITAERRERNPAAVSSYA